MTPDVSSMHMCASQFIARLMHFYLMFRQDFTQGNGYPWGAAEGLGFPVSQLPCFLAELTGALAKWSMSPENLVAT